MKSCLSTCARTLPASSLLAGAVLAMVGPARASLDGGRLAHFAAELRATVRADRVVLPAGDPPVALTHQSLPEAMHPAVGPLLAARALSAALPDMPTATVPALAPLAFRTWVLATQEPLLVLAPGHAPSADARDVATMPAVALTRVAAPDCTPLPDARDVAVVPVAALLRAAVPAAPLIAPVAPLLCMAVPDASVVAPALFVCKPAFHTTPDALQPVAPALPAVAAERLDLEIARNVFDAVRAGQLSARNPALRPDLVTLLAATAFTPEGYHVFETILAGCAGRNDTARMELLAHWAARHQGGIHADLLGYYSAFHLHTTGERAGAIRTCRDLADNSPALADRALLLLALAHSQAGKLTDARATLGELDRRFASSPVAAEGLYLQAWLCLQEGNREAAATLLRRIASNYSQSPTASKARDALSALEDPS